MCLLKAYMGLEAQLHSVAHGSPRSSFAETSTPVKLGRWPHHVGRFHGELVQSRGGASENGQRGEDSAGYFSVNVTQARAIWEGNLKEENAPIGKSDGGIFLVND